MTKAAVGWLCPHCGHAQIDQATAADQPAVVPKVDTTPLPPSPVPAPAAASPGPVLPAPGNPAQSLHQSSSATPVVPIATSVDPILPAPVQSATPMVSGWTDPTAKATKPKRRLPKLAIILLAALLLIGGASASGYWYMFKQQPKEAMGRYLAKLASAQTATFNGNISYDPPKSDTDQTSIVSAVQKSSVSLSGAYDIKDNDNPKIKLNVKGSFGSQSVSGDLLVIDKALFFKIGSLGLLNSFGLTLSNDWYKLPLDESFNDNACYNKTKGKSGTILGQRLLTNLPVKDYKRVGLMQTVDGHRVNHYQGAIDFSRIQSYIEKANQSLPAECKLTYNASDFKGVALSYDIYSGKNFDRLDISAKDSINSGGTTRITMDTSGYNKSVDIKAPAGAKDLKDLLSLFGVSDSGEAEASASSPDSQRKSDLRSVKNALETYYNDTGYYPPGNYAGLTTYLVNAYIPEMPSDPSYSYTPAPKACKKGSCTSYALAASLDNTSDSQIKAGTTNTYEVTSTN